jgi:hypothetical protein
MAKYLMLLILLDWITAGQGGDGAVRGFGIEGKGRIVCGGSEGGPVGLFLYLYRKVGKILIFRA